MKLSLFYFFKLQYTNTSDCLGSVIGGMISSWSDRSDISDPVRIKPKIMKLEYGAALLSMQH